MPTPEKTLQEVVQGFRDKAREILRMQMISNFLQTLFHNDCNLESAQKTLASEKKGLEVARYNAGKLDEKHPNYAEQKEQADKNIGYAEKNIIGAEKNVTAYDECRNETLAEIAKVEKGEVKVSIKDVKSLTDGMIANS